MGTDGGNLKIMSILSAVTRCGRWVSSRKPPIRVHRLLQKQRAPALNGRGIKNSGAIYIAMQDGVGVCVIQFQYRGGVVNQSRVVVTCARGAFW